MAIETFVSLLVDELYSYSKSRCCVLFSRCSEQVTVDLTVTLYQIQARVLESQYKDDVYMVRVTKPEGVGDLIDDEGTLMEQESFDSTEEIAMDTELEVEITGVGSSTDSLAKLPTYWAECAVGDGLGVVCGRDTHW